MRHIGEIIGEKPAQIFSDYLYVNEIGNKIDTENNNEWSVWILDERDIPRAQNLFIDFTTDPSSPKFSEMGKLANQKRAKESQENKEYVKRINTVEKSFASRHRFIFQQLFYMRDDRSKKRGLSQLIRIIIITCGIVYLLSRFGGNWSKISS